MVLALAVVALASVACEEGGPWTVANETDAPVHLHLSGRTYDIEPGDSITFSIFRISLDEDVLITDEEGRVIYDQTHTSPGLIEMRTLTVTKGGVRYENPVSKTAQPG